LGGGWANTNEDVPDLGVGCHNKSILLTQPFGLARHSNSKDGAGCRLSKLAKVIGLILTKLFFSYLVSPFKIADFDAFAKHSVNNFVDYL